MARLSILIAALGVSLCLTKPTVAKSSIQAESPSASPIVQAPNSPPTPAETQFLRSQTLFSVGILLSALALAYGVYEYTRYHRWQRLEFLRRAVLEFEGDTEIRNALKILDFEEYRDYQLPESPLVQSPTQPPTASTPLASTVFLAPTTFASTTFKVNETRLMAALAGHDRRARAKKELDEKRAQNELSQDAVTEYQIETALREWFNKMLNGLEHFGYFIESDLCTYKEMKPWLLYWVRLIGDPTCRREGTSQLYDQLYSYIHEYGFSGVQRLFEKFGYRILPSPYRENDLVFKESPTQYSTKLALSLAKASYLIYQDKKYVAEISRRWGIDIKNNFRYFNNKGRDTQAFIFRTDEFMVLSFRGSQELKDWFTNFNTKLRNFTIRKAGITSISSYKGKVHTGFFLGWAIIERAVLEQITRWRADCLKQGKALPPLLITGHSLGGALATMAAAALSENGIDVAGLYTFGQPRVGDWSFSRQLNNNLDGKVFRFVNNNDIVPHVPPPFSPLNPMRFYGHLGTMKYFDSKGILVANYKAFNRALDAAWGIAKGLFESGFDLIADHSMQYYISYLNKTLQQELEDQAAAILEHDKDRK
ncbi:MAG: lipase family protein [Cyanobacteria bacterium P01_G01_bin.38]